MEASETLHRRDELRHAVRELRDRGLYTSARFAAELLSGDIWMLLLPSHAPVCRSSVELRTMDESWAERNTLMSMQVPFFHMRMSAQCSSTRGGSKG
jgi:hypothetical protein